MTKWSKPDAVAWLKAHDFKSSDYDNMPNWHSFRQHDPGKYKRFTNTSPASGIMFILGWHTVDGDEKSEVQSVRFYHGEADSQSAAQRGSEVKDLLRYKDTWTHQRVPTSMLIKNVDAKQGIVQFYPSSFDVVDDGNEIVRRGAFQRTIEQRGPKSATGNRIAFLRQHRVEYFLGKPSILEEREMGLFAEAKILPTTYGKDTLILYEGGVIDEHSIGYDTIRKQVNEEAPTDLLELRLWDISAVVWGMNPQTPFVGLKSIEDFSRAMNQAEATHRVLGREITDDTGMVLELYLRQMMQSMVDFVKTVATRESDRSTLRSAVEVSRTEIATTLRKQIESIEKFFNQQKR